MGYSPHLLDGGSIRARGRVFVSLDIILDAESDCDDRNDGSEHHHWSSYYSKNGEAPRRADLSRLREHYILKMSLIERLAGRHTTPPVGLRVPDPACTGKYSTPRSRWGVKCSSSALPRLREYDPSCE